IAHSEQHLVSAGARKGVPGRLLGGGSAVPKVPQPAFRRIVGAKVRSVVELALVFIHTVRRYIVTGGWRVDRDIILLAQYVVTAVVHHRQPHVMLADVRKLVVGV